MSAILGRYKLVILAVVIIAIILVSAFVLYPMITAPTQTPTRTAIKIGASLSLTGGRAYANVHSLAGIEQAIEEINKEGGIYVSECGYKLPITLVYYNDENDYSKAATLARKLIEEDGVDFILYAYGTEMYNTYAPIIDEYNGKVLGLGAAAYINAPYNYSFSFFPAGTRYGDVAHEFDEWLKAQGLLQHSKVADVRPVDWKATLDYDTERRAKSGIETVYTYLYTRGQVEDYTPIIQAAVAAGADAFVSSCIIPDGPLLGSQMKASNLMSKFKYIWLMGLGLYKAQYYAAGGKEIYEGVFCNTYPPEELFPAVKEVCDKVRVRLALKPTDAVEFGAVTYYTIVMALKKAIEETGTLNADAIKNYFLSVDYMDPRIGRIKFFKDAELQQSQKTHWQQTSEAAMYLAQQQNGTLQVVWPLNIRTAEPIYPYPYS